MLEIIKQVTAKSKALNIIESCNTSDHFETAERYVELYHRKFEDFLGYNDLKREMQRVRVESLKPSLQ